MFRLTRLRPPHGWNAVAWELAIVTLGVILALAVQQWAENRSMLRKVESNTAALREELVEHYGYFVEFRTLYPCVRTQLDRLRNRVLASGAVMDPVPLFRDSQGGFVLRMPSKLYPTDAWNTAVSDGVIRHFEPSFRRQLAGYYAQIVEIRQMNAANDKSETGLNALTYRIPLDPMVRYSLVVKMEELSGQLEWLDTMYGQQIEYIENVGMIPQPEEAQAVTERYGTYQFCKAQGLPMRTYKEAMEAVPN